MGSLDPIIPRPRQSYHRKGSSSTADSDVAEGSQSNLKASNGGNKASVSVSVQHIERLDFEDASFTEDSEDEGRGVLGRYQHRPRP